MTTLFGAIADDFTGATDLAGLLARSGYPVSLRIGVPAEPPQDTSPFEVIALKIRTEPVTDAVAEARAALAWLKRAGAQQYFWKYCSTFDSTPEGNIGPVAEAIMADLDVAQTIYCPAFPENGRAIFMGNLFVGQLPLSESPMKDHPLTPMRDSNLMRLLQPQVRGTVGLIDRLTVAAGAAAIKKACGDLAEKNVAHIVVDAVENADLARITEACADMRFLTGGSAIAMPIPQIYAKRGLLAAHEKETTPRDIAPKGVILSGSCSAMTNAQVARYQSQGKPSFQLDPLSLKARGLQPAMDWLAAQDLAAQPLIYATATPDAVRAAQDQLGKAEAGAIVEAALADLAVAARDQGARRIVVAGGETSGAVTKALRVDRLDIGPEIAAGVPWCFCTSEGQDIALTLKSGNFGAESFFNDAFAKLEDA